MRSKYSNLFPTPSFLAMHSCAIDISDQSIKYGVLAEGSAGLYLKTYGQERVPAGVIVSGKIENEKVLVETLKKIQEKENLSFIRVALPEEQMYLFAVELPLISYKEIGETVLLQIEEYVPLSASEVVFDYKVLSVHNDKMLVQVVATAASLIDSYLSVFTQAKLVPLSFEIEAQAITRAVRPFGEQIATMIVDFGETRTGISIAYNDSVLFTSTFDMGGKSLTEMVAKNFGVSFAEAEEMKKTYGIETAGKENDLFPVILSGLSVLRDELVKHYTYWHTHVSEDGQPHPQIEKVILCGGDSNLTGIAEYFSRSMKIPVEYANAWVNVLDIKKVIPRLTFEDSLSYVTVIGLALGDYTDQ